MSRATEDDQIDQMDQPWDLVIAGGSPAGTSVAIQARRAGLERVLLLRLPGFELADPPSSVRNLPQREIGSLDRVEGDDSGPLRLYTDRGTISAGVCLLDLPAPSAQGPMPFEIPISIAHRIHTNDDFAIEDADVLVVGDGDSSAVAASQLSAKGARVVLALTESHEELSLVARQLLTRLERGQRITILWHSVPTELWDQGGYPMVGFADRMTPDLQFDHVLLVREPGDRANVETRVRGSSSERIFKLGGSGNSQSETASAPPAGAWEMIRSRRFPHLAPLAPRKTTSLSRSEIRDLENDHYNATLTGFDTAHNELWRIRVTPDREAISHRPGQYCSLGLGYWEPRADDSTDPKIEVKQRKLVRRSYSISSPIFDANGYLIAHPQMDGIELYIVWVTPNDGRIPALTPRLALKQPGDRLYLGPKVAGRYTVNSVRDPTAAVVFCATGTGEAPHNAMIVELLSKGHIGPIVSVVTVRYWSDLAYLDEHERLATRFTNYKYVPVPTREPDVEKRYIQDLIEDGTLEESLGRSLRPGSVHFYLCGNPAMIGLPEWIEGEPRFPPTTGVAQLLHEQGFTLDRRNHPGTVHYEEYW